MKKVLTVIFCTIIFAVSAQKNDTLVRNIEIERDYVPEVAPVIRPHVPLEITEPSIEKAPVTFSEFSMPSQRVVEQRADFIPIAPQRLTTSINREKTKPGFLRVGAGPLCTWLADFWYPVWNTNDGYFDIAVHHDGIFGIVKPTKKLFNTGAAINFNYNLDIHQLYLGAKYDNETFNYYGNDTTISNHYTPEFTAYNDSISKINQPFHNVDFKLGVRSNKRTNSGWLYDAYLNYHIFSAKIPPPNATNNKITENNINAALRANILINGKHNIDVGFGAKIYFYNKPKDDGVPQHWKPNTIIHLLPAYLLNTEKVNLRLGLKTFFNFNKGTVFAISPDVKLDYFAKEFLNLYVGVTGNYNINSLANITDDNRYYKLDEPTTQHTYTPLDIFGGIKVKAVKGLLFDVYAGYKYVNNEIFYTNAIALSRIYSNDAKPTVYRKTFFPINGTGWKLSAGLRASYNIKERVNISAQVEFNNWNFKKKNWLFNGTEIPIKEKVALHVPVKTTLCSDFKIGKKFFGSVNMYITSGFDALRGVGDLVDAEENTTQVLNIVSLPATFDLNLGFGYNIKKNISLFVQANNILALAPKLNYQTWYGYNSFGAHLLFGATILF